MSNNVNLEHVQDNPDLKRADKSYIVNMNDKKYLEAQKRLKNLNRVNDIESAVTALQDQMVIIIERLDLIDIEIVNIKQRLDILEP